MILPIRRTISTSDKENKYLAFLTNELILTCEKDWSHFCMLLPDYTMCLTSESTTLLLSFPSFEIYMSTQRRMKIVSNCSLCGLKIWMWLQNFKNAGKKHNQDTYRHAQGFFCKGLSTRNSLKNWHMELYEIKKLL